MSSATTGDSFKPLEDARVYQGDLWCHKIRFKYLSWSVLSKLFAVNLVFPEWQRIPSGQFNCQFETTSQQPRCQREIFFISVWRSHSQLCHNATPQNRLCLKDSVSQCDWCSLWDPAVCLGLKLGSMRLASSQLGEEKSSSWNNRQRFWVYVENPGS